MIILHPHCCGSSFKPDVGIGGNVYSFIAFFTALPRSEK
jgi:hypothetical protein